MSTRYFRTCASRMTTFGFLPYIGEESWSLAHVCRKEGEYPNAAMGRLEVGGGKRREMRRIFVFLFFVVTTKIAKAECKSWLWAVVVTAEMSTVDLNGGAASCGGKLYLQKIEKSAIKLSVGRRAWCGDKKWAIFFKKKSPLFFRTFQKTPFFIYIYPVFLK